MSATPEFIRWALEQRCQRRQIHRWCDPQQTERQLRPLRAYCEAVAEDRVFEGICLARSVSGWGRSEVFVAKPPEHTLAGGSKTRPQPPIEKPKGFRAEEILEAYGGENFIVSLCGICPANSLASIQPQTIAGCYGLLEVSGLEEQLHAQVEEIIAEHGWLDDFSQAFLPTEPRWNGLWANELPNREQLQLLHCMLLKVAQTGSSLQERLAEIIAALAAAIKHRLPLHLSLTPAGRVEGDHWIVPAHCLRCKALYNEHQKTCSVCGQSGPAKPLQRRHVRGQRPYWSLEGFLGKENVEPFLERYRQCKNRHSS